MIRKSRKAEADTERAVREFRAGAAINMALSHLHSAEEYIEHAGNVIGTDEADMLACFAANTLHGSRALLRELRAALRQREARK